MTAIVLGWDHALYPVLRGGRPDGSLSLADLGTDTVVDGLATAYRRDHGLADRQAALTVLHVALGVVRDVLLVPYVVGGVALEVRADQLAAVVDHDGSPHDVWVGEIVSVDRDGERLGRDLVRLLAPVSALVAARAGLRPRAVETVVDDSLRSTAARLVARDDVDRPWSSVEVLLRGTGFVPRVSERSVVVRADDGPEVRLRVPSVCCVLHREPCSGACPTCPQLAEGERVRRTEDWLRALDEDEFLEVVGRRRIVDLRDRVADRTDRGRLVEWSTMQPPPSP